MIRSNIFTLLSTKIYPKPLLSLSCQKHRYFRFVRRYASGPVILVGTDKQWNFTDLKPYGRLVLRSASPIPINFKLTPVNPHDCPSQDQANIRVVHGDSVEPRIECRAEGEVINIFDSDDCESAQSDTSSASPIECDVQLPLKYDCDVKLEGRNELSISQFENQDVDIQVQHGDCHMKNIKAANIQIRSDSGSIHSESLLQGNLFIQSDRGDIRLHKPQSQTLTIHSQEGDVHIQNLYADRSSIRTHRGDVQIGSCHRNAQVSIGYQGNLKIDSVDGTLQADIKDGNVDVQVSKHEWINIKTGKGDVNLKIPSNVSSTLEVKCDSVKVDKSLVIQDLKERSLENGQRSVSGLLLGDLEDRKRPLADIGHIHVESGSGSVDVKCQDWLSSLNLGMHDVE